MKNNIYKTIYVFIFLFAFSADSSLLRGYASDAAAGESLEGIYVEILESGESSVTGDSGIFIFDSIPAEIIHLSFKIDEETWITVPGKYNLQKDTIRKNFILDLDSSHYREEKKSGADSDTSIKKEEKLPDTNQKEDEFWLPTMTIRGRKLKKTGLGKQTLDRKAIKKMPGLAEPDVMRSVQLLPGVVASSDFSNKLYVRGGSSDQNLIMLDLATVYNPSHFGGFFSTFNVDAIKDMEFYKGGFPARFGNRLSSVLDIRQRNGKDGFFHGGIGISLLSGKAYYEGGVPEKASWIWTYRRTWIDKALEATNNAGITDLELPYFFYDSQGKIELNLTKKDTVSFSGYFGEDVLDFENLLELDWGNKVGGVNYRRGLNNNSLLNMNFSYSIFNQEISFFEGAISLTNNIKDFNIRAEWLSDPDKDISFSAGIETNNYSVLFEQKFDFLAQQTTVRDKTVSDLFAVFFSSKMDLLDYLSVTPGIRQYYYTPNNNFSTDLRLDIDLKLTNSSDLLLHTGRYTQYLTSVNFADDMETPTEYWYAVQNDMRPSVSYLFSGGIKKRFGFSSLFSFEGYYKLFDNLPIFGVTENSADTDSDFESNAEAEFSDFFSGAQGYSMGIETTVKKDAGIFNGYISYALGTSVVKENEEKIYFAKWDKRHSFNIVGNFEWFGEYGWKKSEDIDLTSSLAFKFGTGLPYTRVLGVKHIKSNRRDEYVNIDGDKNGERYPVYSRLDATIANWTRAYKNFTLTFYYQIINVFDTENVYLYQYDYNEEEGGAVPAEKETFYQLPRIPVFIGSEIQF
ncbi:MAG: TonB-dependent receptor plug domain-containing protein [Fibrobacterota bacterium]